eukprot:CAMPEP_0198699506 /NCGR_PEP_ID=MMETSP1468-20131203/354731_1 /TAXON_ID=1461545 /ORGANISM="Mantoniella sp, Strain CCMP1436" /LENGTH=86 /DNA_ID=CAMNT_0044457027 /DNA_START=122 /DNA_END=382 /DNA_ORIENTATION=+
MLYVCQSLWYLCWDAKDANLGIRGGEDEEWYEDEGDEQDEQAAALHEDLPPPRLRVPEGVRAEVRGVAHVDPKQVPADVLQRQPVG